MGDFYNNLERRLERRDFMAFGNRRGGGGRRGGKSKSDNYVYSSSFVKSIDTGRGAKKVNLEEDVTEIFAFSLTEEKAEQFLKKFQEAMDSRDGDGGVRITAYCNAKENDKTGEIFDSASILIVGKYPANNKRGGGGRRSYRDEDDDRDDRRETRRGRSSREEDEDDKPSRRKGRREEEEEEEEDRVSEKNSNRDRQETRGRRGRDSEHEDEDEREVRKGDNRRGGRSSREDSERSSGRSRSSSKKDEVDDDDEIPF